MRQTPSPGYTSNRLGVVIIIDCPGNKPPGFFFVVSIVLVLTCLIAPSLTTWGFLYTVNKKMITHTALQHMALLKATQGLSIDTTGVKFNRIVTIAQKAEHLTPAEIEILEHFVHSNSTVLNNTVYIDDQIIHPVTSNVTTYYKKASTGRFAQRAPGSGLHMKKKTVTKRAVPDYTITPQSELARRPRGRPRKNP